MQVAQVSKADAAGGGASALAVALHEGLLDRGIPSLHYCVYAGSGFNFHRRPIGGHSSSRLMQHNLLLKSRDGLADILPIEAPFFQGELEKFKIDLFHFHDTSSAISPLTIEQLARVRPIAWTLHDCSAFTGGCLYPMSCNKWMSQPGCRECPQHGVWPLDTKIDTAWIGRDLRARLHQQARLELISPSRWLAEEAARSGLIERPVRVIPNGISARPFQALSREAAREKLGIGSDRLVLCFSSGHLADKRKNIEDALLAVRSVSRSDLTVVVLGKMSADVSEKLEGLDVVSPGFVTDKRELAHYLAASDAMIFTSLAENHPLSVLEAMAAGVCVMGYDTGGVKEQVEPGSTGLLVKAADRDALAAMFGSLPSRDDLRAMGAAGRARFETHFTLNRMIGQYVELFGAMIEEWPGRSNA